jgi:hypothetical protein
VHEKGKVFPIAKHRQFVNCLTINKPQNVKQHRQAHTIAIVRGISDTADIPLVLIAHWQVRRLARIDDVFALHAYLLTRPDGAVESGYGPYRPWRTKNRRSPAATAGPPKRRSVLRRRRFSTLVVCDAHVFAAPFSDIEPRTKSNLILFP